MQAERVLRVVGFILTLAVIAGSVYAGYRLFHRFNEDPWEAAAVVEPVRA